MLPFKPISLEHRDVFNKFAWEIKSSTTELCFVACYIWSHKYKHHIAVADGSLFIRLMLGSQVIYFMPMGGELRHAVTLLKADAATWEQPLCLRGLTRETADAVEALFPGEFTVTESRDSADYLYNYEDLARLEGKKYHSKRNFTNRFERDFAGRWQYERVTEKNKADVWAFQDLWCRKNDCSENAMLMDEANAIALLLHGLDRLGAVGGALRLDGEIVAFTLGSQISDGILDVHVEKADYETPGAYQMIHRQFLLNEWTDIRYVNREEDMGVEGLRKAKLSYHPCDIVLKYDLRWKQ